MNAVRGIGGRWLACLALAMVLAGCGRKIELMNAIPESEANEVVGALQNGGIAAEKVPGKEGMVGVAIPADKVGPAVDLLREKGLPRERFAGMGQVFKKEGLISSPTEERARYLFALSQELSATLSQIDGVVVARVHVVLPERSSSGDAMVPSSAAVFIKHHESQGMETVLPLIRRLVVNSIPGLTPEKVTIVLFAGQANFTADRVASVGAGASPAAGAATVTQTPSSGGVVIGLLSGLLVLSAAAGWFAWRKGWLPSGKPMDAAKG
jgi:type III secretion protein J